MNHSAVEMIDSVEAFEDCGRDHACSFCPIEAECNLDQGRHNKEQLQRRLGKINWVIPVMANKGGVGKSTVSANLAAALAGLGYAVESADADIHGPNAPRLFGLHEQHSRLSKRGLQTPEYAIDGRGTLEAGLSGFDDGRSGNPGRLA